MQYHHHVASIVEAFQKADTLPAPPSERPELCRQCGAYSFTLDDNNLACVAFWACVRCKERSPHLPVPIIFGARYAKVVFDSTSISNMCAVMR